MKKIVVATKNQGKVKEILHAFQDLPVELVSLADFGEMPDAVEDGQTFEENAQIKAAFYQQQTGCACLADDSGLEVSVLGNAPGVYSARFAGEHADDAANNAKLVTELERVGVEESSAAYRCVLAFIDTDGTRLLACGSCPGAVRKAPRGKGGFGYDPYFYVGAHSIAELSLEEKDKISHRGQALHRMAEKLRVYLG